MSMPGHPLPLHLDRGLDTPVYLQLYQRFREAIDQGRLPPGARVPSLRSLASELNLARGTVEAAYQMLIGEGYLLARGPAGTCVSPRLATAPRPPSRSTRPARPEPRCETQAAPLPFQLGLPALDAFPRKLWARLAARRLRELGGSALMVPDAAGHGPLRASLAGYLGISRGIHCRPEQVFITAGHCASLALVQRALMTPGDAIWLEDPGYLHARQLLQGLGVRCVPVPVDGEGLVVDAGQRLAPDARFALVTPTHQSPTGVALSLPRRLALLERAQRVDGWVLEDDYDSEYRYQGRPLPALKSLDREGRVLYAGTFSKVLYPGLRLAYLVVPEREVERFRGVAAQFGGGCSELLQATTADFIDQGHFARHLKKMRSLYARRRAHTCEALLAHCGEHLDIDLQAGGMHLLARLAVGSDDRHIAERAQAAGLAVIALSPWYLGDGGAPGLLLGFTNVATAEEARGLAGRLREVLEGCGQPSE
ncbi:PLP-dependent aminotransferase family protein [Pseudomonas sp. Pc102]|uniref:MocR-like pyridoxine biosynthesis transcription factor PdxR n=1 Tax=Pseudomonas sp. Pc102 TaxID=2678261 RepID=UPI001FD3D96F|nr:PLP-dependent aminotransferase family protein [Pseudomonas sp. Pc102]